MKYKNEFEFLVLVLNDYLATLPVASKMALGEKVQHCVTAVEQGLQDTSTVFGGQSPEEPIAK